MSGGSFEYLETLLDENPLEYRAKQQLDAMIHALTYEFGSLCHLPEAAFVGAELMALRRLIAECQREMARVLKHIAPLIHAVEWAASGDCAWDSVQTEVNAYRTARVDELTKRDYRAKQIVEYTDGLLHMGRSYIGVRNGYVMFVGRSADRFVLKVGDPEGFVASSLNPADIARIMVDLAEVWTVEGND